MSNLVSGQQPLVPSILDRLLATGDQPRTAGQVERQIQEAVRRDLEELLNTHPLYTRDELKSSVLRESLLVYGIPDITGVEIHSETDAEPILETVTHVIRLFEPRLRDPRVTFSSQPDLMDPTLRFRISAVLFVYPLERPVTFDSRLHPPTGAVRVGGGPS